MDLDKIVIEVTEIAYEAADLIRRGQENLDIQDISAKGTHDYVTEVDKASERLLVRKLSDLLPDSGFLTEEATTEQQQKEYTWIIDPLDGTTNFMHKCPPFAVSIALTHQDKIVLGVIYEINSDEMFTAIINGPAKLNGEEIHVSKNSKLEQALIATGFPFINYDRLGPYMEVLQHYMLYSQGVRRLGSAATDLAYVACGRYDAFYEYNLNPWDVAAGTLILQCAGGKVSDFTGGENYLYGKEIVASNGFLHDKFLNPIQEILVK